MMAGWLHAQGGGYGVALFFALSGLLICSRLLQEEAVRGRIDLKGFYIRRFCRIQPAALVYLVTVAILSLFGVIDHADNGIVSALLFARNYTPSATGDVWYTAHFWSLSIEEHFYFVVPALLILLPRLRVPVIATLFVCIELLHRFLGARIVSPNTDLEGGTILLGALAAVLLIRPQVQSLCIRYLQPWAVLPLVGATWVYLAVHNSGKNYLIFVLTLPLLILSTMLHPLGMAGRLLETTVFKFIGRISYSLYLWQQMFFVYAEHSRPDWHPNLLISLQHSGARYLLAPALAIASYYWVEKPLIRLGHRLAAPATPGRGDLHEPPAPIGEVAAGGAGASADILGLDPAKSPQGSA